MNRDGTLTEWIAAYLDALPLLGYSPKTVHSRRWCLGIFDGWCRDRGITHGREVTKATVVNFQRWLHTHRREDGTGWSISAQANFVSTLRAFGKWCASQDWMPTNPAAAIDGPKMGRTLPRDVLTREQIDTLMLQPDLRDPKGLRDRAILEVIYAVAANTREIAAIEDADVTPAGMMTLRPSHTRSVRTLPLGERAAWWVERYRRDARGVLGERVERPTRLFLSQWGLPMVAGDINWIVRKYCGMAKLPTVRSVIVLRDTVAVHLLDAGCDLRFLAALFGHADLQSVRKYAQVSIRHLKQVHARYHPAEQERG